MRAGRPTKTLAADKAYDAEDFVNELLSLLYSAGRELSKRVVISNL